MVFPLLLKNKCVGLMLGVYPNLLLDHSLNIFQRVQHCPKVIQNKFSCHRLVMIAMRYLLSTMKYNFKDSSISDDSLNGNLLQQSHTYSYFKVHMWLLVTTISPKFCCYGLIRWTTRYVIWTWTMKYLRWTVHCLQQAISPLQDKIKH